jgi:hypothetical protein
MRLTILLPLALSLVAFILSFLALFAGHNHGFMEEYSVLRVSTLWLPSGKRRSGRGHVLTKIFCAVEHEHPWALGSVRQPNPQQLWWW